MFKKNYRGILLAVCCVAAVMMNSCDKWATNRAEGLIKGPKDGVCEYGYFFQDDCITLSSNERYMFSNWDDIKFDYLCIDTLCEHSTEDEGCGALIQTINQNDFDNDMCFAYNGKMILTDTHSILEYDEVANIYKTRYVTDVYEADIDGTARKLVKSFDGGPYITNIGDAAIMVEGKVYFGGIKNIESVIDISSGEERNVVNDALFCLDLNDYSVDEYVQSEKTKNTLVLYQIEKYGDYIYYIADNTWTRVNYITGECEKIYECGENVYFLGAIGDRLFYYNILEEPDTIYYREIGSDAEHILIKTDEQVVAYIYDENILVRTQKIQDVDKETCEYTVLDEQGNVKEVYSFDDVIVFRADLNERLFYVTMSDRNIHWIEKDKIEKLNTDGKEIGYFICSVHDELIEDSEE